MTKQAPEHIKIALSILEDMDDKTRRAYKSSLPRYATNLHKAGEMVSAELLKDHIAQGLVKAQQTTQKKTYDTIVAAFKAEKKQSEQPDELPNQNNVVVHNAYEPQQTEDERERRRQAKETVERFCAFAKEGNLVACEQMIAKYEGQKIEGWGEDAITYKALIEHSMKYGHLEMLKSAVARIDKGDIWRVTSSYGCALQRGDMDMMRYVCEELDLVKEIEKKYSESPYSRHLKSALKNGHWAAIEYTLPNMYPEMISGQHKALAKELLNEALHQDSYDDMRKVVSWGLTAKDYYEYDEQLYHFVTMEARRERLRFLLSETDFFDEDDVKNILQRTHPFDDREVIDILNASSFEPAKPRLGVLGWGKLYGSFLREHLYAERYRDDHKTLDMAQALGLPKFLRGPIANTVDKYINEWERMGLHATKPRMSCLNPERVGKKTFEYALGLIKKEGLMDDIAHEYAYHAAALFRSPDRILQYLEKWGSDTRQPLHDVTHMIKVPQKGEFDAKSWGDAVLQHGPKMAKLVTFADRIAQPLKSDDGKVYSYAKTKAETAKFIYKKAQKHPEFAALCHEQSYKEGDFSRGLKLIQHYQRKYAANDNQKTGERIPNLSIEGSEFGMEGYTFRKLEDGNVKGLLLGAFTDCCQHLASAGAKCAEHGFISPQGGFYVLEDADGGIVAQSWAWRGDAEELVLDSLEHLNGRMKPRNWEAIIGKMSEHIAISRPDISALNIGTGGKTPNLSFNAAAKNARPIDYSGYRDSEKQYCAYQKSAMKPALA